MIYSVFESEAFGLNVYRDDGNLLENSIEYISSYIIDNNINIIRFSIDANKFDYFDKLNQLNFPLSFNGSVLNYSKNTKIIEAFDDFYNCDLVECTINDSEVLVSLVNQIFEHQPVGYTYIKSLQNQISKQAELTAIQQYILSLLKTENSGVQFLINKDLNEIVGFAAYIKQQNSIYRPYAGIINKHRNLKYYEQLIINMIQYNYTHNIDYIRFGVKITNLAMLNKYNRYDGFIESVNQVFILSNIIK